MENSLIISFIILFFHATTWKGHIFYGIRKIIPEEKRLSKPIYSCPICMSPWWGTMIYWIFFHNSIKDWLLTVGAAAGMAVVFVIWITEREAAVEIKKELQ